MWTYVGKDDPTRISKEDLSTNELEKIARSFIKLTQKDEIPSSCRVTPLDKENPPLVVSFRVLILFCWLVFPFSSCSSFDFLRIQGHNHL